MAEQRNADEARRELVLRLKRAEGQIRGVQNMIEAGNDCEDIAQQLSAARKALDKAFYELMACAIQHPQFSADQRERHDARIERLTRVLARLA
jgi:DNA-binding FrmR family transcriptional regulator